jgi:hypothetical protein
MVDRGAQRLWEALEWRGGMITLDDATFHDIERGIIKGWLNAVGIGRFEATKDLRQLLGA